MERDILGCQSLLYCHLHEPIMYLKLEDLITYCEEPDGLKSVLQLTFMSPLERYSIQFARGKGVGIFYHFGMIYHFGPV